MNWSIVLAAFVALALLIALLAMLALASRHKKTASGHLHLIGATGRVETELEPEGSVLVNGELWRARARQGVTASRRGSKVRVTGASGHLLEVEPSE